MIEDNNKALLNNVDNREYNISELYYLLRNNIKTILIISILNFPIVAENHLCSILCPCQRLLNKVSTFSIRYIRFTKDISKLLLKFKAALKANST